MVGPFEALLLALPLVFAIVLGIGIFRAGKSVVPEDWAANHGITLTERSRPMVLDYLTRSRRFRLIGALLGLALPLQTGIPGVEMIGGYLLGALLAEFTHKRLVTGGGAAASLSPRGLTDYVPGWVPNLLRSLGATGAVLLAVSLWGPERVNQPLDISSSLIIVVGIASLGTPLLVELFLRRMADRSQPAASSELVTADDAIRAASMHAAAGAGIAVSLLTISALLWSVGVTSDLQPIRWTFPLLAVGSTFAAVSMWLIMGPATPWKVTRSSSAPGAIS